MTDSNDPGEIRTYPSKALVDQSMQRSSHTAGLQNKMTRKLAQAQIDQVVDALKAELHATGRVHIQGFGVFTVKDRKARTSRDPRTGATIQVPAKQVVTFKKASNY